MTAQFPEKFQFLFNPARYKIGYGGRGGAKSWGFARALLLIGAHPEILWPGRTTGIRALCARETMQSLAESVHQLLEDQAAALGLGDFYRTEKKKLYGANGTEMGFAGLRHNIMEIKSYEGADIVWVEEAGNVTKHSWDTLIPTIRRPGSEIWASFNPELPTDDTYKRFVLDPPDDAVVVKTNYYDNPWFGDVLQKEMEACKAKDEDDYRHIWLGEPVNTAKNAIYANELRAADNEGRITRVPYDASKPVHTAWDLGWGDFTSIWMFQAFPFEFRLIDFLQSRQHGLDWYLAEMQRRPYVWGADYLPHDATAHQLGSGRSVQELMIAAGRRVIVVPKLSVADGIGAGRALFNRCWFDREKCADGIQALRHYRYGEIQVLNGAPTREPLHDESSHGADAFRVFAVGAQPQKLAVPPKKSVYRPVSAWS